MRTKVEIMDRVVNKSKEATSTDMIKCIHSLYTLEMLIDIRDILYSSLDSDQSVVLGKFQRS